MFGRSKDLACQQAVARLSTYVDDLLEAPEQKRMEEHLVGCDACRTYLAQLRTTVEVVSELGWDHLSIDAQDALVDKYRDWWRRRNQSRRV